MKKIFILLIISLSLFSCESNEDKQKLINDKLAEDFHQEKQQKEREILEI